MESDRQSRPRAPASRYPRTPGKSAATQDRTGSYFRISELKVQNNSILKNLHQAHVAGQRSSAAPRPGAPTMRASDTAIYRSPRRSVMLALAVGIAACVSIPFLTANDMPVQIAGAVWL